jgi:DNA adenine methylase
MKNPTLKPPLKWVGGKQRILPTLLALFPSGGRLIEPFVGAGSVFLNSGERDIVINDSNRDLVSMYEMLRDAPRDFIRRTRPLFASEMHSSEAFAEARLRFNSSTDKAERAALLVYLNKFAFNGLYRVNSKGQFNVPYGHPKSAPTFPEAQLEVMASRLVGAKIMCGDFRQAITLATAGDVLYCDPPYADSASERKSFVGYTSKGFTAHDHIELRSLAIEASLRGATVILSNHDTSWVRNLYAGMEVHAVNVRRSIAANATRRANVGELIAVLRPA